MPAAYENNVFLSCEGDLQDEVGTYTSNGQSMFLALFRRRSTDLNSLHLVAADVFACLEHAALDSADPRLFKLCDIPVVGPLPALRPWLPRWLCCFERGQLRHHDCNAELEHGFHECVVSHIW